MTTDPMDAALHAAYADGRADEREALASELVDAARYRWLRQQHWFDGPALAVVANPKSAVKLGHDMPTLERLDAAIDAARGVTPPA